MGFLGSAVRAAGGLGKAAFTGGFAARASIGAGVGGIAGIARATDYENPNVALGGIIRAAGVGAVAGGAIGLNKSIGRMLAPAGKAAWTHTPTSLLAKNMIGTSPAFAGNLLRSAGSLASSAVQLAGAAIKHPFAVAGIAGAGFLGYSQLESAQQGFNSMVKVNYNQQALAAETMRESGVVPMGTLGTAPQMMGPMQRSFQNSTDGLVQGLNRGRHG